MPLKNFKHKNGFLLFVQTKYGYYPDQITIFPYCDRLTE